MTMGVKVGGGALEGALEVEEKVVVRKGAGRS